MTFLIAGNLHHGQKPCFPMQGWRIAGAFHTGDALSRSLVGDLMTASMMPPVVIITEPDATLRVRFSPKSEKAVRSAKGTQDVNVLKPAPRP